MKKIISAVLLSTLMTASCNQEFIELTPISTVGVDQLYKTDNDFRDALTGAYRSLRSSGMQDFMTVFPVPLAQIQVINDRTIFPQNPGYN